MEKEINLNELLSFCRRIQHSLVEHGRSMQHDYIILNLYNLVSTYPCLRQDQLIAVYEILKKAPWEKSTYEIKLDNDHTFIARSPCFM